MNQTGTVKVVSEATLRRLPLYHRLLKDFAAAGRMRVSGPDIAGVLELDPTQVRKDLETAGIAGRPRIGYVLADVIVALEEFLGWRKVTEAFLVGAGSMGAALLGYRKFEECGLRIVAAFDTDPSKVGRRIHGKHVLPLEKLSNLAERMHILIGIITVPAAEAQDVADQLVAGGVRAIWNFAPVRLRTPASVIVHNEDLYCSLAALSQKLAGALKRDPAPLPAYPFSN
ncbi:MAG TPA: redox-sensing transcriptional repressor Rex [Dongiaceae bacterium]|jgi:redox-sensing transcriptional repressor|nr:redox-sensing transcriptional repressor Rex [Dongiaceae bacterium]